MVALGSFTHVYYPDVSWDSAKVSTVIFRFQKGIFTDECVTNDGVKRLVCNDGFLFFSEKKQKLGDFFDVTVGAVPTKTAKESTTDLVDFFVDGEIVKLSTTDKDNWPRFRKTKKCDKIFVRGLTRKRPLSFVGDSEYHTNIALIPKVSIDIETACHKLNEYFINHGKDLGLFDDGRFGAGVSTLINLPIEFDDIQ
jgi:hypothetical protein